MCDPLTIAGVTLSGLSAAASASANSSVMKARDDALNAERIRQRGYQQETAAINARAQDRYEGYDKKQGDRAKELADYFTGQEAAPVNETGPVALPASSSNITVSATNQAKAKAKAFTDKTGTALGELRSFGDLMGDLSRSTARDAGYIGQVGGFMKGSSNVVPYELEAANGKGAGMRLLGDILGGAGKIGTAAGLSGANLPGLSGMANIGNIFTSTPSTVTGGTTARPAGNLFSLFGG